MRPIGRQLEVARAGQVETMAGPLFVKVMGMAEDVVVVVTAGGETVHLIITDNRHRILIQRIPSRHTLILVSIRESQGEHLLRHIWLLHKDGCRHLRQEWCLLPTCNNFKVASGTVIIEMEMGLAMVEEEMALLETTTAHLTAVTTITTTEVAAEAEAGEIDDTESHIYLASLLIFWCTGQQRSVLNRAILGFFYQTTDGMLFDCLSLSKWAGLVTMYTTITLRKVFNLCQVAGKSVMQVQKFFCKQINEKKYEVLWISRSATQSWANIDT